MARDLFPEVEESIDLGAVPPAGSGASSVRMAHAVEDEGIDLGEPEAGAQSSSVELQAVADAEAGGDGVDVPSAQRVEEEVIDLSAPPAGAPSSGIELRQLGASPVAAAGGKVPAQASEEEVLRELESAAAEVVIDSGPGSGSSIDLDFPSQQPPARSVGPESGIDLLDLPGSSTKVRKGKEVEEVSFEEETAYLPTGAPVPAPTAPDSGVEVDSALDLEVPAAAKSETPSGRDLIAEAVESGVDLDMAAVEEGEAGPTTEIPDEPAPVHAAVSEGLDSGPASSSVDLSSGEIDLPPSKDFREELQRETARVPKPSTADAIDLEGLPEVPSGSSGVRGPDSSTSAVDLGSRPEITTGASVPSEPDIEPEEAEVVELSAPAPPSASTSGSSIFSSEMRAEAAAEGSDARAGEAVEDEAAAQEPSILDGSLTGSEEHAAVVEEEAAAAEEEGVEAAADEATLAEEGELVGAGAGDKGGGPRRGGAGGWLGGTFLGLVLGVGVAGGLWAFGIEPPAGWKFVSAPDDSSKKGDGGRPTVPPPQAVADAGELVRRGDFAKAKDAGIFQSKSEGPEDLRTRAEARWFLYLQDHKEPAAKDQEVKDAIADLNASIKKSATPRAYLLLGQIQEVTEADKNTAIKTYTEAADKFKSDAKWGPRFEKVKGRLQVSAPAPPPPEMGALPRQRDNDVAALTSLLIGVQDPPAGDTKPKAAAKPVPPPKGPGAKDDEDEEAGFEFWEAMKLSHDKGKTEQAIKSLKEARSVHEKHRLQRLRKAQNPLSDPTEEIFLRCCDELLAYWQLQERFQKAGYSSLLAAADAGKEIKALVPDMSKAEKAAVAKLVEQKVIKEGQGLEKGVDQLLQDREAAAKVVKSRDDAAKQLMTAKVIDKPEELEKGVETVLTDLATARTEAKKTQDKLAVAEAKVKDKDALEAALKPVVEELKKGNFIKDKAGNAELRAGLLNALRILAMDNKAARIHNLEEAVARDEAALKQRRTPEELLNIWLALLETTRDTEAGKDMASRAIEDADRVQADSAATAEVRARAEIIRGLALRNEQKFVEAKAALEKGIGELKGGDPSAFMSSAQTALKMVQGPGAWYAEQARALLNQGRPDQALVLLNKAMDRLPKKDQPPLLATRSLLYLDAARTTVRDGAIPLTNKDLQRAQADALAAAAAGQAVGLYAAGRVAEEAGRLGDAAVKYRKAMEAHPALDAEGSRYRIALARVLVQPREAPAPFLPPAPKPAGDKATKADTVPANRAPVLALLVAMALQAPMVPAPSDDEAVRLAQDLLDREARGEITLPFDVRAEAYAITGQWTRALDTYALGLRDSKLLQSTSANGLLRLIHNHPRLMVPDNLAMSPLEAERHFAAGVNFYFDGNYGSAEKELAKAIANDSQDARYFYFLGLAKLALGKRDAIEDIDQGARLERANRPPPAAVSETLERVQGPVRRIINQVRTRPQ
jgi:hypothetical protein